MISSRALDVLYQILCAAFCVIVVTSNIISAKMVEMPFVKDFSIPAGGFIYPITFLLSDLVTEIYGAPKAKLIVFIALGMNLLSLGIIEIALMMPTPDLEMGHAFHMVLGLSSLRIMASLAAYLIAQVVDIELYALIKRWTGMRWLWLRNNGSTCLAQIVDTVVVDVFFLYWGMGLPWSVVMPIIVFGYAYKVCFSVVNTPLFYLSVFLIRRGNCKA